MLLEPLAGGSTGLAPVVEGPVEWECVEIERAFQVAASAHLDAEQFRVVAHALLARLARRALDLTPGAAFDADELGGA